MNYKYRKPILLILAISLTTCTNWLDIDPVSEIGAKQLYETKEGFDVAINGVYMGLAEKELYGGELNYGVVEAMSRSISSEHQGYEAFMNHDYENEDAKTKTASIWEKSYNLIANCNKFIEELNKKDRNFFKEYEYDQYLGQAIAARALLHFNLVRLFTPYHLREDKAVIPYCSKISSMVAPKLKTSVIMDSIIVDLQKSRNLLAVLDTLDEQKTAMQYRQFRFTYSTTGKEKAIGFRFSHMSVTALLARVALWHGKTELAYESAFEAYGKWNVQPELKTNIASGNYDRLLSYGLFMGLYNSQLSEVYKSQIGGGTMYINNINGIFPYQDGDYRRSRLIKDVGGGNNLSIKYSDTNLSPNDQVLSSLLPIVRVSEMMYIVAELMYDENPANALFWLNWLRNRRGASSAYFPQNFSNKSDFMEYLVGEIRKDFIGEGQLFFYYKRLNMPVRDEATFGNTGKIMTENDYTLPIPESELVN